jgi:exosortase
MANVAAAAAGCNRGPGVALLYTLLCCNLAALMTSDVKPESAWSSVWNWLQQNPLQAFLGAATAAIIIYFFGFVPLFANGSVSAWLWGWQAWNPETDYEHAKLIPLIVVYLVWNARAKLKAAPVSSSRLGWVFLALGILLYLASARTLQARLALTSIPFLLYGIVLYVWGKHVARVLLFPIAFLLFMVPLNFLTQATASLQFVQTGAATAICNFFGMNLYSIGTAVHASSGAFQFEVDEGCSGIRSLMAIAMLSAIYGHRDARRSVEEAHHLLWGRTFCDHRQRLPPGLDLCRGALFRAGHRGWPLPRHLRLSGVSVRDRRDAALQQTDESQTARDHAGHHREGESAI